MTAVDTKTCQVEFEIGIPLEDVRTSLDGGIAESSQETTTMLGYLSPDLWELSSNLMKYLSWHLGLGS